MEGSLIQIPHMFPPQRFGVSEIAEMPECVALDGLRMKDTIPASYFGTAVGIMTQLQLQDDSRSKWLL